MKLIACISAGNFPLLKEWVEKIKEQAEPDTKILVALDALKEGFFPSCFPVLPYLRSQGIEYILGCGGVAGLRNLLLAYLLEYRCETAVIMDDDAWFATQRDMFAWLYFGHCEGMTCWMGAGGIMALNYRLVKDHGFYHPNFYSQNHLDGWGYEDTEYLWRYQQRSGLCPKRYDDGIIHAQSQHKVHHSTPTALNKHKAILDSIVIKPAEYIGFVHPIDHNYGLQVNV